MLLALRVSHSTKLNPSHQDYGKDSVSRDVFSRDLPSLMALTPDMEGGGAVRTPDATVELRGSPFVRSVAFCFINNFPNPFQVYCHNYTYV